MFGLGLIIVGLAFLAFASVIYQPPGDLWYESPMGTVHSTWLDYGITRIYGWYMVIATSILVVAFVLLSGAQRTPLNLASLGSFAVALVLTLNWLVNSPVPWSQENNYYTPSLLGMLDLSMTFMILMTAIGIFLFGIHIAIETVSGWAEPMGALSSLATLLSFGVFGLALLIAVVAIGLQNGMLMGINMDWLIVSLFPAALLSILATVLFANTVSQIKQEPFPSPAD